MSIQHGNLLAWNVSFLISFANPPKNVFFINSLFIYYKKKTLGDFSKQISHFHDNWFKLSSIQSTEITHVFEFYFAYRPAAL